MNEDYAIDHENKHSYETLDKIRRLKKDFQTVFMNPAGNRVLDDFAEVMRANKSCFHPNARVEALLEGRRDIWLYIQQMLHLSSEQLLDVFNHRSFSPDEIEGT